MSLSLFSVVSNVTLTVSQKGFLQTLGALGAGSPLPALLFPLCCRKCGLTLEDDELQAERGDGDSEGQVQSLILRGLTLKKHLDQGSPNFLQKGPRLMKRKFPRADCLFDLIVIPQVQVLVRFQPVFSWI